MRKGFSFISGIFSVALTLVVIATGAVAIADTIGWRPGTTELTAATSANNDSPVGQLPVGRQTDA